MKLIHYLLRALHWTPDKLSTWYHYHNKKLKGLLLIAIVLFLSAKPSTADFRTEEDKVISLGESLPHSIVIVQDSLGHGTGFYISPFEVITDEHVVHGLNDATTVDSRGKACKVEVYYADPNEDLALLNTSCEGIPLKLAPTVKVGQTLVEMGNPETETFFFTKGIVSSLSRYLVGFR
jgi:S1-C subfamily serine protease